MILAYNRDDHTRQHALLFDADDQWHLAPAYDLTFSSGPGGEHYLAVEGEIRKRAMVIQAKTGKPVRFELMSDARASPLAWLERRGGTIAD